MADKKQYSVTLSYEKLARKFDFDVQAENEQEAIKHIEKTSNAWWGNIHGKTSITARESI